MEQQSGKRRTDLGTDKASEAMRDKYQRPVRLSAHSVSYSRSWNGYYGAGDCNRLTDSVLARSPASRSHMSAACVSIVPSVTSSSRLNFVTSASYPKVKIRAFGRSSGRSCRGQRTPFFVHVVRRLPNSPWTNTTLVRNQLGGSAGGERGDTCSIFASSGV